MPLPFGLGVLNGLLARGVFPRWLPKPALRPTTRSASGAAVRITWWGTAAHVVSTDTTTVLLDPFLSRPGLLDVGLWRWDQPPRQPEPQSVRPVLCRHVNVSRLAAGGGPSGHDDSRRGPQERLGISPHPGRGDQSVSDIRRQRGLTCAEDQQCRSGCCARPEYPEHDSILQTTADYGGV